MNTVKLIIQAEFEWIELKLIQHLLWIAQKSVDRNVYFHCSPCTLKKAKVEPYDETINYRRDNIPKIPVTEVTEVTEDWSWIRNSSNSLNSMICFALICFDLN